MANYLKNHNIIEEKIHIGKIPAILFRPKGEEKNIPTIIFYHGWGSNKENQRIRGFILANLGYQVIIPDAIHHGERSTIYKYNVEDAINFFWDTIFTNIEESQTIIDNLIDKYDTDPNRIGVIGNSMGGFTAAGVFTHNPSVKALVVFNGSCKWTCSNQLFKKAFKIGEIKGQSVLEEKIAKMDPVNNLESLIDRPMLLLHGENDTVVSIEGQNKFYKKVKPLYKDKNKLKFISYPNLNHFVTTNMLEESIIWFYKYLNKA